MSRRTRVVDITPLAMVRDEDEHDPADHPELADTEQNVGDIRVVVVRVLDEVPHSYRYVGDPGRKGEPVPASSGVGAVEAEKRQNADGNGRDSAEPQQPVRHELLARRL